MTDHELALAHAPILLFDRREPFLPSRVGYTVLREPADSPVDFRRQRDGPTPLAFDVRGLDAVIEYAIWWDWDIQHLYELEAAWVYRGAEGEVLRVEASWHGRFNSMEVNGAPPLRGARPVLYSQPGKHAFAASPDWFTPAEEFTEPCRDQPGTMGVLVTELFRGKISKTAADDRRVHQYLRRQAFTPSFVFDEEFAIQEEELCPWPELEAWIPRRVAEVLKELRAG
jgi:hypothetical protein